MAYDHTRIENVLNEVALALWGRSRFEALTSLTCTRCGKPMGVRGYGILHLRRYMETGLCSACLRELEVNDASQV